MSHDIYVELIKPAGGGGVVVSAALMFTVSLTTSPASAGTLRQFFEDPREELASA